MTQMTRWRVLVGVLVLTAGLAACGDDKTPTAPTPPPAPAPPPPPPPPAPTNAVFTGTVSDVTGARIAGARVTVIDGPDRGLSILTNAIGEFRFGALAISNANFSATSGGYREVRAGTYVDGNNTLNFVFTHAILTGTARDTDGARVGGATITVLDGPNAGVSVGANSDGDYRFESLMVANANAVATAEGYDEARGGTFVNGTNTLDLTLTKHAPPEQAPGSGTPTVTITAKLISGGGGSNTQEWEFEAIANVALVSCDWGFGDGSGAEGSRCVERRLYRRKGTFTVTVDAYGANGERLHGEIEHEVQ
ncbi:MAG: Outer rane autotransporter barrel protein [Acidobacteria bacterium]|nr:Outer rane autotransporter barrel protein [Acidobacteriota bacterium]